MIDRAIHLMLAINAFIEKEKREWEAHYKRAIKDGMKPYPAKGKKKLSIIDNALSCEDWDMLKEYMQILKPLKETTELLEGRAA
jgi:hypothetical protein